MIISHYLTLDRSGILKIGMAGGGQILCNFRLNDPIDLKFGM